MSFDELIAELERISSDPTIQRLASTVRRWKSNDSTVSELRLDIERFLGHSWIEEGDEHAKAYSLWSRFRDQEIDRIGGMTMNERLYSFGLFDRFDACTSDESRLVIYKKLLATP